MPLQVTRLLSNSTRRILSIGRNSILIMDVQKYLMHNKGFINGEWVDAKSKKTFEIVNPANDQVLTSVPDMGSEDVEDAISSAYKSFQSWKETTAKERSQLLRSWHTQIVANKDAMAKLMTLENGKPMKESLGEVNYSSDYIEFYAEEAKRIHGEVLQSPAKSRQLLLIRQPVGVCGMLTPWNFPLAMIARKVAAALASGCTCVIKPAEDTPLSALMLAAMAQKAGMPPGVLNVVPSSRQNTPQIGQRLCASPKVAAISFTGSTAVGKLLYQQCAPGVKRLSLELGGNAPFIVFESADLNKAVEGVIISKFRNSGQTCVSSNRIFVHQSIHDQFVAKLKNAMAAFVVGDGLDDKTTQGPLINKQQFEKVSSFVQDAVSKGARVIVGGRPHELGKTFYEPTLLTNINSSMQCYQEEIFGPVALLQSFTSEEEVIKAANDTTSGLAGYFFSNDLAQIWRVAKELEYGMVGINEGLISAAEAAFGGIKESGFGREGSSHGIDEYTYVKYLCFGNLA